eukprot:CAMPEP_0114652512 /NCGR_PEP_ID=MMETSP0191-20121206/9068_1 /TAXON_ID=126664 /ORGANISM="Sorites sp." /LENGTH=69 /DNA_ID=CAMNT_0001867101 /DNA_START=228 /DNA_END=437 /DNA_ORIENTATION=-
MATTGGGEPIVLQGRASLDTASVPSACRDEEALATEAPVATEQLEHAEDFDLHGLLQRHISEALPALIN